MEERNLIIILQFFCFLRGLLNKLHVCVCVCVYICVCVCVCVCVFIYIYIYIYIYLHLYEELMLLNGGVGEDS